MPFLKKLPLQWQKEISGNETREIHRVRCGAL
jgi:hypothetical protein